MTGRAQIAHVIGAGPGGLCAALCLATRGWQVTVHERAPALEQVGAGIQIAPNGFAVLDALGLGEALRDVSFASQGTVLHEHSVGRRVAILPAAIPGSVRYIHRAALVELLVKACEARGVILTLGADVPDGADGPALEGDLIVAADGIKSQTRQWVAGESSPSFTGQVAWRALVPAKTPDQGGASVYMGPGRHVVMYPLPGDLLNIVAIEEREDWREEGWSLPGDPDALRSRFADFGGPVRAALAQVTECSRWALYLHPVAETWHRDNVALLGDAAHPTLPFLAQGANLAFEDAWALAACTDDLPRYQMLRKGRTQKVVREAAANATRFHHRSALKRFIGHNALKVASTMVPGLISRRFDWVFRYDITTDVT
ncbi:MAG: FAD-dependent monooxygenase [Shimia sp.]